MKPLMLYIKKEKKLNEQFGRIADGTISMVLIYAESSLPGCGVVIRIRKKKVKERQYILLYILFPNILIKNTLQITSMN